MAEASVRLARAGDGLAIATVQLEVWQIAFAEELPAEVLDTSPADLATAWTAALDSVLIAEEGTFVVGFAQVGAPHQGETEGELRVLYVRPAWARRGHGGRLLVAAAAALRVSGARTARWWLPVTDVASQRFARAAGWERTQEARTWDSGVATITERCWTSTLDHQLA
jgi:ribosomal protein S18 acetylase RimI-like enzyme